MLLEILLFTVFGIGAGLSAGLLPGWHPNSVLAILLGSISFLAGFPVYAITAFIVSLSITNSVSGFLPSILFGAPDDSTELSVMPGQQMMMEGKAYEALFLTVVGGVGVVVLSILAFPLLLYLLPLLYNNISSYIHYILIFVVLWMIFSEKNKGVFYATLIFFFSGIFGVISLASFPSVSIFPALTGLFGISGMLLSFGSQDRIPKQIVDQKEIQVSFKGIFTGWIAGLLVGILPGIGSSQAGVIASNLFKVKAKDFLTALGGINTSNIFFTLIAFFSLGKTRSGAAAAISEIITTPTFYDLIFIVLIGLTTVFVAAIITLKTGKFIIKRIENTNYNKLNIAIMVLLIFLVIIFSGAIGLLILFIGTFIGILASLFRIKKSSMMGFFLLPTILYFSGLSPVFFVFLGL